jgi:hypothetical protein
VCFSHFSNEATCLAYQIRIDLITLVISGGECKLRLIINKSIEGVPVGVLQCCFYCPIKGTGFFFDTAYLSEQNFITIKKSC